MHDMRILLAFVLVFLAVEAGAVTVTLRVTVPETTPLDATVFVTGNFQDWDPGDPDFALTPVDDRVHAIDLEFQPGTRIEFRFTRGSWGTAERDPAGREITSRRITVDEGRVHELAVPRWADTEIVRTLTGDVTEHTVDDLLDGRRVWVYLPPGYRESDRTYPVLYMLDGQNVFDVSTSFAGEWRVDETCEEQIAAGAMQPIVVVALDNGGARRVFEYTPSTDARRGIGGGADAHFTAIVDTLMPWVERSYRVRTGPAATGFAGSSLGGLMALVAALEHDDHFGRIGAISPSLWWDEGVILDRFEQAPKPDVRLWADMGTEEGSDVQGSGAYVRDLRELRATLLDEGFVEGEDLIVHVDEGGRHHEEAWARRFGDVLRFLFPPDDGR